VSRQAWAVFAVSALLLGLVWVGWTERDRFLPVEVGTRAPDFTARNLRGEQVALSALRGDVVLLNIWATWCPPCREEMPSMQRLHETLGPSGLRVVAVSIDALPGRLDLARRPGGDVAAFVREYGLGFAIWHDPSGEIQRIYRTTGIPESFVIGRDGVIVSKVIGATEWDSEARIESLRRLLRE
jgi:peroxiredoxin